MGNKFVPDKDQRLLVQVMGGLCGMPHEYVALQIINPDTNKPITRKTLERAFKDELKDGKARSNAMVQQSLFRKAIGKGPGSVTAAIYWTKAQMGWREAAPMLEFVDKTGKTVAVAPVVYLPANGRD